MKHSGNTILITGGSTGIGRTFAERFLHAGNKVIICGRRESVLAEAQAKDPALITRVCDVAQESQRIELYDWVTTNHPDVNVLVNHAGTQQPFNVRTADARTNWTYYRHEIATNLDAPVHLAAPYFAEKEATAILNVTSGLAFTPFAIAPLYSATKAALHSFTVCLRLQLSDTSVEVIEVAPPAVQTQLGGGTSEFNSGSEPLDAFADGVLAGLEQGMTEIGYGSSIPRLRMSRDEVDQYAKRLYEATKSFIE